MEAYLSDFLSGPVAADTIDGTLYAIPSSTDAQFLYYRQRFAREVRLRAARDLGRT